MERNHNPRLPGFTAEASFVRTRKRFSAVALAESNAGIIVPQVWCDSRPALGTTCCEEIFGELLCYVIGKHTQM
jgi:hypothetical protein